MHFFRVQLVVGRRSSTPTLDLSGSGSTRRIYLTSSIGMKKNYKSFMKKNPRNIYTQPRQLFRINLRLRVFFSRIPFQSASKITRNKIIKLRDSFTKNSYWICQAQMLFFLLFEIFISLSFLLLIIQFFVSSSLLFIKSPKQ